MSWKHTVNRALARTGHQLQKLPKDGAGPKPAQPSGRKRKRTAARLTDRPAFVLSSVRSGSTLVRVLLNSHSQIHSPVELHLRDVKVELDSKYADRSFDEIGLDARGLEYLLWDRILDRELTASGKQRLVKKTPSDVFIADRIKECWPDAQFIYLLRHPVAIARSRKELRPQDTDERNNAMVLRYGEALQSARDTYDGLTVRYEDITADPRQATQDICGFLGVPWEEQMLDYGRFDHGRFKSGLGDWKENIKSGKVQPAKPLPSDDEIPAELRGLCEAWGYAAAARTV